MKLIPLQIKRFQTVLVMFSIQAVLLSRCTNGQFHWGSNSRPTLEKLRALVRQQLRTPGHYYHVDKPNSGSDKDESINSFLDDPVSVILQSRPRRGAKPYIMRCHSMGPMSMLRRCVWEQTGAPKARRFYQEFPDFY